MHKRIIGGVAAALAGALALALLNVNFLVRRNKDYLIDRAEQALGRKISADQIEVTFWPAGARLTNFALPDDPAVSAGDFLRAKDLRVELQLLSLFSGQFRPRRIALESPRITIVRDAEGRYNFARAGHDGENVLGGADAVKRAGETLDRGVFLIPSLNISDGTVHYHDLRTGGDLVVSRINLNVSDFEPNQPFELELEAAVAAAKPNIRFKSRIGAMSENRDYREVPLDGEINTDGLDLGAVNKALPQFRRALPRALRFNGIYTIKELKFKGTLNNLSLKGTVTGSDASFRFE